MEKLANLPKRFGVFLIRLYQIYLRALFPSSCRFHPTCSEYSLQAVKKYGLFKGVYLGIRRILRCHGGNPGGVDELY